MMINSCSHLLFSAFLLLADSVAVNNALSAPLSRRAVLSTSTTYTLAGFLSTIISSTTTITHAAETVGKDPDCNDSTCLGVWDGLLADCNHSVDHNTNIRFFGGGGGSAGCVSSQDDTPGIFAEPWDYSESNSLDWQEQIKVLIPAIQLVCAKRGDDVQIVRREGRYLRVLFTDRLGEQSTGEFYFTPNDTTVQFRLAAERAGGSGSSSSSLRNMERAEMIRKKMGYLKLPVLRNRKRTLFVVESDLDTFGPGSAALGPPAEMKTGELDGRQDVDPSLKIDLLQQFPTRSR